MNAAQARRIADEPQFIADIVTDPLLAPHLAAIQRVADYCWQHSGESWLIIEGP